MKKTITIEVDDESLNVMSKDYSEDQVISPLIAALINVGVPACGSDVLTYLVEFGISEFEDKAKEANRDQQNW